MVDYQNPFHLGKTTYIAYVPVPVQAIVQGSAYWMGFTIAEVLGVLIAFPALFHPSCLALPLCLSGTTTSRGVLHVR
jgi:hypothetical protein